MRLKTANNTYQANNFSIKLSEDMSSIEAYSFRWWKFVIKDKVGNVIFNRSTYSNCTSQHQSKTESVLDRLNVRVAIRLRHTRENITCIKGALSSEIGGIEYEIKVMKEAIARKGSWKKTNAERVETITKYEYRIKDLTRYRDEYIDKKIIPILHDKSAPYWFHDEDDDSHRNFNSFKKYFLKPNGKLKRNEFNAFTKSMLTSHEAPRSIDKLKNLLKLKNTDILPLLEYQFTRDLENQIPNADTVEYQQLVRWAKRFVTSVSAFTLDKMHTYLTNKQNRPEYEPSVPTTFEIHPNLEALRGVEDLKIIDTDSQLRAEGRKQSHCIGGSDYIDQCKDGYQVLNYKGYTFFLDPHCEIEQTQGKHNSSTPSKIRQELNDLLESKAA